MLSKRHWCQYCSKLNTLFLNINITIWPLHHFLGEVSIVLDVTCNCFTFLRFWINLLFHFNPLSQRKCETISIIWDWTHVNCNVSHYCTQRETPGQGCIKWFPDTLILIKLVLYLISLCLSSMSSRNISSKKLNSLHLSLNMSIWSLR